MLHHLSFAVADLARSAAFYDAALSPLGYVRVWADETAVGYGSEGGGDKFAIKLRSGGVTAPGPGFHVAFAAPSREAVTLFYRAALLHGGHDNGAPGLCPEYGEHYYAAFVIDPDAYRIEAVINEPVSQASQRTVSTVTASASSLLASAATAAEPGRSTASHAARLTVAKIMMRVIGTLAGLLGIGSLFFTPFVLHQLMVPQSPLTILFSLYFAFFSLAVDAYFIYAAYLVWFRFSPLAVRHMCGLLGFSALVLVAKLADPLHHPHTPWAPLISLAGLGAVYFGYRAASNRLSRFLFPQIVPGILS
jgi:catechol 2,3-dioxygenase-like lactoylglutathione lyase family enzyme